MDFTGLAEHIVSSLAGESYVIPVEVIQASLDSFTPSSEGDGEIHTCERTVNGKDGPYICGKECKNSVGGMWFCGTENSGHYKSALTAEKKVPAPKGKTSPKAKGGPSAKSKSSTLVSKIRKVEQIDFHEIVPGSGIWLESNFRIVADPDTKEAYGILAEDNETILELDDEALSFLQAHNLSVREDAMPAPIAPKAKAAPKGKAPVSKAAPKGKAPTAKAVAKGKAPVAKAAPKGKVPTAKAAPKGKAPAAKAAAKGKAPVAKAAPKGKAPVAKAVAKGKAPKSKGKAKSVPSPTEEDDATLEELQQGLEDAAVEGEEEPDVSEIVEEDGTGDVEEPEVDFGAEGETGEVEEEPDLEEAEVGEEESPDIVEEDEGEAIEDDVEGEVEAEADD